MLRDWTKEKRKGLPFGVPMVWREPKIISLTAIFVWQTQKVLDRKTG